MITTRPLKDVFQTAAEMRRLTCQYWADLGRWLDAPGQLELFPPNCHNCWVEMRPDNV